MVQIRQLTAEDPAFEAWHAGIRAAHRAGRESSWWESPESTRVYLGRKSTRFARMAIGAFDGATCVGGAELAMPLQHDIETISVELGVPPLHRGRGVGTSLAAYVENIAAQHDRTVLQAELHVPAGMTVGDTDGGRFASARGMRSVSAEDRFLLELPVDGERVAKLRAVEDGYRITSFVDRVPDAYVVEWARMQTHMNQDVPMGELTHTPQQVDVTRIRDAERTFAEQGWTRLRSLALTPDGSGAGYTEMFVSRYDDEFVIQDDTFVDRSHRGHRLGARLKLANLDNLDALRARTAAGRRWVQTYTEQHNTAMQHTNDAFGFRRVDVLHELEGPVGGRG